MEDKIVELIKRAIVIHNEVFGTASNVVGAQSWRNEVLTIAELLKDNSIQVVSNSVKKGVKDGV